VVVPPEQRLRLSAPKARRQIRRDGASSRSSREASEEGRILGAGIRGRTLVKARSVASTRYSQGVRVEGNHRTRPGQRSSICGAFAVRHRTASSGPGWSRRRESNPQPRLRSDVEDPVRRSASAEDPFSRGPHSADTALRPPSLRDAFPPGVTLRLDVSLRLLRGVGAACQRTRRAECSRRDGRPLL